MGFNNWMFLITPLIVWVMFFIMGFLIMYSLFFPSINSVNVNSFYEFKDLISLAILSTSLAYIIYFRLLFSVGAVKLLLVIYLIPISASILGIFLLNEKFTVI